MSLQLCNTGITNDANTNIDYNHYNVFKIKNEIPSNK